MICALAATAAGCGGSGPRGMDDAGAPDAGPSDAAATDSGDDASADAGDAATDAGSPADAGGCPAPDGGYDLSGRPPDSWRGTSREDEPTERYAHTALWTGTEMIVWGGLEKVFGGGGFLFRPTASGARYDPGVERWRSTSLGPSPRDFHSAIWTGSEMIVWGGEDGGGVLLGDGARYDPCTDRWRAVALLGPAPRRGHSAVWTGTEMILWGGVTAESGPLAGSASGARYDPAADVWQEMSTEGAPAMRSRTCAVWTGSLLVVWESPGAGGGRYDPATDTWSPVTIEGAAPGRCLQAVWTGKEMIVWGGTVIDHETDRGARYDPAQDRWDAMSIDGAPAARSEHSVVWSGTHLLVWAGTLEGSASGGGGLYTNSGGGYDPEADRWSLLSSTLSPTPRVAHTAIWTGQEMIVWGGHLQTGGGRYRP